MKQDPVIKERQLLLLFLQLLLIKDFIWVLVKETKTMFQDHNIHCFPTALKIAQL